MVRVLLALLLLCAPAAAAPRVPLGDTIIRSQGAQTRYTFIRADGNCGFTVPATWDATGHLTNLPEAADATFRIDDPALHGPASISVIVTIRPEAMSDMGDLPVATGRYKAWTIYTLAPPPPSMTGRFIDAVIRLHGVHVRITGEFPRLPSGNAEHVTALLEAVMDSVAIENKPYAPRPGETIVRKAVR
ncbi:MAG TPA: hypothetical protein VG387_02770 [Rhizomicrobium sp.]|jgi:hypothetical protein|nr:hypothetical protein [Rhizomicrobium sp.]